MAELKRLIDAHDKVLRKVPVALDAVGDQTKIAALPGQRDFGCGLTRPLLAPYNDTAYEELIQSGRTGSFVPRFAISRLPRTGEHHRRPTLVSN